MSDERTPTVLTEEHHYETEAWREPKLAETDKLVRSEHGRIAFNIDYRSHWFVLVEGEHKYQYAILVKHGGGEERVEMPRVNAGVTANIIASLSSDQAYLLMHHIYDVHKDARRQATTETKQRYQQAFVDGRLKKRKLPSQGIVKVWIEEEIGGAK